MKGHSQKLTWAGTVRGALDAFSSQSPHSSHDRKVVLARNVFGCTLEKNLTPGVFGNTDIGLILKQKAGDRWFLGW